MDALCFLLNFLVGWWPYRRIGASLPTRNYKAGFAKGNRFLFELSIWIPLVGWLPLVVDSRGGGIFRWWVVGFEKTDFDAAERRPVSASFDDTQKTGITKNEVSFTGKQESTTRAFVGKDH